MPVDVMYGSQLPMFHSMSVTNDRQNDKKAHGQPFDPGDLVWLHSPAVPHGHSRRLHRPWTGPYRIVAQLSDAIYRIQHS